jgi:hypothetical protein
MAGWDKAMVVNRTLIRKKKYAVTESRKNFAITLGGYFGIVSAALFAIGWGGYWILDNVEFNTSQFSTNGDVGKVLLIMFCSVIAVCGGALFNVVGLLICATSKLSTPFDWACNAMAGVVLLATIVAIGMFFL